VVIHSYKISISVCVSEEAFSFTLLALGLGLLVPTERSSEVAVFYIMSKVHCIGLLYIPLNLVDGDYFCEI